MEEEYEQDDSLWDKLIKNKWLIVAMILVVGFLTNPNLDQHKSAVKNLISKGMGSAMKDIQDDKEASGIAGIGLALGSMMLNNMIDSAVSSQNLLLFSLTKLSYAGESRIIGIGLFGNVFIFDDKLDTDNLLKEK